MRPMHTIVIHCSAAESGTVEGIRAYHKSLGWADIGYHYVVYKNGTSHKGRPIEQAGSHVRGANAGTVGICLIGNTDFKVAQIRALQDLILHLRIAYPSLTKVRPHHFYPSAKKQGKTCPNEHHWPVENPGAIFTES